MKKRKFEFTGNFITLIFYIPLFISYRIYGKVGNKYFSRMK